MTKKRKAKIPVALRNAVWNTYIGADKAQGKCFCGTTISIQSFDCGHVVAESKGGSTTLQNLRPICKTCNCSMGSENMKDFIKRHGLKVKAQGKNNTRRRGRKRYCLCNWWYMVFYVLLCGYITYFVRYRM